MASQWLPLTGMGLTHRSDYHAENGHHFPSVGCPFKRREDCPFYNRTTGEHDHSGGLAKHSAKQVVTSSFRLGINESLLCVTNLFEPYSMMPIFHDLLHCELDLPLGSIQALAPSYMHTCIYGYSQRHARTCHECVGICQDKLLMYFSFSGQPNTGHTI